RSLSPFSHAPLPTPLSALSLHDALPISQCCQPVPGDPVVGYVTQGRGISIHRHDCPNLLTLSGDEDRRVEIDWREVEGETFVVRLAVSGEDRRGLYADICEAIRGTGKMG